FSMLGVAKACFVLAAFSACGDDDKSDPITPPSMDASTADAAAEGGSQGNTSGFAIKEDFDDWKDDGGRDFFVSKGDAEPYSDHNTVKNIDGQDCLWVHADAADNDGYGFS